MEVEEESEPTFSFDSELLGRQTEVKVALCVKVRNEAEEEKEGYSMRLRRHKTYVQCIGRA